MDNVLCVLAVHFSNHEEVLSFVARIRRLGVPDEWRLDIRVVDNSCNWPETMLAEGFVLCSPNANLGYLNGCLYALESWRREHGNDLPEMVLVCNTDLIFEDDALRKILEVDWPDNVAAIGPDIRTTSGLIQNPFLPERPSKLRVYVLFRAFSGRWLQRVVHSVVRSPFYGLWQVVKDKFRHRTVGQVRSGAGIQSVYAVHGSAIFLTRSFFEAGCEMRLGWQMFGEEIHLAEQIRLAGLAVLWMPGVHIQHEVSSTLSSVEGENIIKWRGQALSGLWKLYFR